jgi:DNA-binding LytR/AlgR family response regulator
MKKLSTLIIEDNELHATELAEYLTNIQCLAPIKIVLTPQEGIGELLQKHYDLLFLDIEMPGISGMEVLKSLRLPPTIIVTSHPSFAANSFDIDAVIDFIEKPVTLARLTRAVQRVIDELSQPLFQSLFLKVGHQVQNFNLDDILYIEANGVYSKIITKAGVSLANINISDLEKKLTGTHLVRLHKSFIYNLTKISAFDNRHLWIEKQQFSLGVQYRGKLMSILNVKMD